MTFTLPTVKENLAKGICPACLSPLAQNDPEYIACKTCNTHGNPKLMRWCERVPVFDAVGEGKLADGQLYKKGERYYVLVGMIQGCGRALSGDWCDHCREYAPPHIVSKSGESRGG